jgi:hypothetical protein
MNNYSRYESTTRDENSTCKMQSGSGMATGVQVVMESEGNFAATLLARKEEAEARLNADVPGRGNGLKPSTTAKLQKRFAGVVSGIRGVFNKPAPRPDVAPQRLPESTYVPPVYAPAAAVSGGQDDKKEIGETERKTAAPP